MENEFPEGSLQRVTSRRAVVTTGAKLAYAAPLVAASFKVSRVGAQSLFSAPPPSGDACTHGFWKANASKCGGDQWPAGITPSTPFTYAGFSGTFGQAMTAEPNCPVFQGAAALVNQAAGLTSVPKAEIESLIAAGNCRALTAINETGTCQLSNSCKGGDGELEGGSLDDGDDDAPGGAGGTGGTGGGKPPVVKPPKPKKKSAPQANPKKKTPARKKG